MKLYSTNGKRITRRRKRGTGLPLVASVTVLIIVAAIASGKYEEQTAADISEPPTTQQETTYRAELSARKAVSVITEEMKINDAAPISAEVPLSGDLQGCLALGCREYDVPIALALGVIQQESTFKTDAISEDGHDFGLFQVRDINFESLQKSIGVESLEDPEDNIKAGLYILGGLLEKYGSEQTALMAYNMGETGAAKLWSKGIYSTEFSRSVMKYAEEWEAITG